MAEPLIELRDLRFAFGQREVIRGLNWRLTPGHFYGIVGPNGCGKTTLLMLMTGYYRPKGGKILLEGRGIDILRKRFLATKMALVPQDFTINFDFRVFDVVMMGRYPFIPRFTAPSPTDIQKVRVVLEEMEIDAMADRSVMALSGGEKQRVVFARALAQDVPLLLLDEATSNMDIRHTLHALDRVADRVAEGKTAVGVFHNLNLAAMYCDRLVFMAAGRIVRMGDTESVLDEETIARVFEVKSKIIPSSREAGRHVVFYKGGQP